MGAQIAILAILFVPAAKAAQLPTPQQDAEIRTRIDLALRSSRRMVHAGGFQEALRKKRELERKMGLPLDSNGEAMRAPSEAELRKLNGFWSDRRDEYRQSVTEVTAGRRNLAAQVNAAIELVGRYYGIYPDPDSGIVRFNADPPNAGQSWRWRVRLADSEDRTSSAHAHAWISNADGAVILTEDAFRSVSFLAFELAHEAMHFNLAVRGPEYGMLASQEDIVIYTIGLSRADQFGLSKNEFRYFLTQAAGLKVIEAEERARVARGLQPSGPHGGFGLTLTDSGVAEVRSAVEADLAAFDSAVDAGGSQDALERLRAGAQTEFVKGLSLEILEGLVRGWKTAKRVDLEATSRELWVNHYRIDEEARLCRFGRTEAGHFYAQGVSPFRLDHGNDLEAARAAFLLVDACMGEGQPKFGPCNDAIDVIARRWSEPGFKNRMMKVRPKDPFIDGLSSEGKCLIYLRDHWTPRGDFEDLKKTIDDHYWKTWREEHPDAPPPPPVRRERPERPDPPQRRGGGCYWTNDGREICP